MFRSYLRILTLVERILVINIPLYPIQMMKVTARTHCGNAPKMAFLKAFHIALAQADTAYLMDQVTDDVVWHTIGGRIIKGKEALEAFLKENAKPPVTELELEQILSHGKEGAVNGILHRDKGSRLAFAHFCQFNSAKGTMLRSITAYQMEI